MSSVAGCFTLRALAEVEGTEGSYRAESSRVFLDNLRRDGICRQQKVGNSLCSGGIACDGAGLSVVMAHGARS